MSDWKLIGDVEELQNSMRMPPSKENGEEAEVLKVVRKQSIHE